MLASLKRLTKHSAVYGLGHIITRVVNFLLLPLYTNYLPIGDFGATQVVYSFIAVMTVLYTVGIDSAFLRYFIMSEDPEKRRHVFSTAFWSVLATVSAFTAVTYFFASAIDTFLITEGEYAHLIRISAFILAFDALAFLPFLFLRAEEKSHIYIAIKFTNVLINVGLNIYFIVYLDMGIEGMLLANLWASGLTFLMTFFILIKQISFLFNAKELVTLLKFGLPFLPSTLSVVLLDLIDRPLLERMAGLEATGIYSANAKLGMFMALLVTAFRFAWHPFFLTTSKQENAKAIFSRVLTYFTLILAAAFLILTLFIDDIVQFQFPGFTLLGQQYWSGLPVVPPILLSYIFYGMYVNFMVGVYLKEKTKYLPIITFAGVIVTVVINLIFVPRIGIMGAAYARLAGHVIMCVMLYLFAKRFYTIRYEFGRLLKIALCVSIVLYAGQLHLQAWELLYKIGLLLLLPLLLFLTGFFEKQELNSLRGILNSRNRES